MKPWPKIDPGEMVHQITILKQHSGIDVSGTVVSYQPILTTWAAIDPVSGTDVLQSGQDTTKLFLQVRISWQSGVEKNMRVQRVDGRQYVIQTIENPGERNVILVLFCLALGLN